MKRVYNATNLPDAQLVHDLLEQAGIAAHIFNTNAAGAMGEVPVFETCPQVWIVQPHQETYARQIIAAYQKVEPIAKNRTCPQCGESVPGAFDICWNCNSLLPADAHSAA